MNPADVSASAVAAQVPAIYKSMKPSMKVVYDLLRKNYPDKAIEWIGQMKWGYRDAVPVDRHDPAGQRHCGGRYLRP